MSTEAVRPEADATVFACPSPATEVAMLAVFVATGAAVTRSLDYQQFSAIGLLLASVSLTVGTEVLHEAVHVAVLRRYGRDAEVRWRDLAVVPVGECVPRRELLVAVSAPVVSVTAVAAVALLISTGPLLAAAAGYVLVVNATVSVLDVGTAFRVSRWPRGAVVAFGGAGATMRSGPGRVDVRECDPK